MKFCGTIGLVVMLILLEDAVQTAASFFPETSSHLIPPKNTEIVPSHGITLNTWYMLGGFTCAKQTESFNLAEYQSQFAALSEASCILTCTKLVECRAAQWVDLSTLLMSLNQRFCKLYKKLDSCWPLSTGYFEKNQKDNSTKRSIGRYCSSIGENKSPTSREELYSPISGNNISSPMPDYEICEKKCDSTTGQDGKACIGFNYQPQEIPYFFSSQREMRPCWLFFTDKCIKEAENRVFIKAFTQQMAKVARKEMLQTNFLSEANFSMVDIKNGENLYMSSTGLPFIETTISTQSQGNTSIVTKVPDLNTTLESSTSSSSATTKSTETSAIFSAKDESLNMASTVFPPTEITNSIQSQVNTSITTKVPDLNPTPESSTSATAKQAETLSNDTSNEYSKTVTAGVTAKQQRGSASTFQADNIKKRLLVFIGLVLVYL